MLLNRKAPTLKKLKIYKEKENNEKNAQRVEEMKLKKTEQKDRALVKIGRKRIKVLRKMFKQRKAADTMGKKRDIIEEYSNFGSSVYAGITREGLNLDKLANKYEVQPEVLGVRAATPFCQGITIHVSLDILDHFSNLLHPLQFGLMKILHMTLEGIPYEKSSRNPAGI